MIEYLPYIASGISLLISALDLHRFKKLTKKEAEFERKREEKEKALEIYLSTLESHISQLDNLLSQKNRPVYIENSQHAICSQCRCTVARYFHKGGAPVCANCDLEGYTGLVNT